MKKCIGVCSLCGGQVMANSTQYSVLPMIPRCERCNAEPKRPVIEMQPATASRSPWASYLLRPSIGKIALLLALCASASPVLADQGFDIGRYFDRLEDRLERLEKQNQRILENQADFKNVVRKLR